MIVLVRVWPPVTESYSFAGLIFAYTVQLSYAARGKALFSLTFFFQLVLNLSPLLEEFRIFSRLLLESRVAA